MNKSTIINTVVVVVIIAGAITFLLVHNKSTTDSNATSTSSTSTSGQAANTNSVAIENFAFSPANITIQKGTTVTWTNKDSVAHTVTETDGQDGPNSGNIDPGKSFVFTFDKPGTYHYHCSIHTDMVGTVTVTS